MALQALNSQTHCNDMHRHGIPTEGALQRPLPFLRQSEQQGKRNAFLQFRSTSSRGIRDWPQVPQLPTRQARPWMNVWYNPARIEEELRRRSPAKAEESYTVWKGQEDCTALLNSIKKCGRKKDLCRGSRIHAHAVQTGLLKSNIHIGTALLRMYAKCGAFAQAQEVFDRLPVRDAVSWTALIGGYAEHGLAEEALKCFEWMQDEGVAPDAITFSCILKACGNIGATQKGEEIHAEVCRLGLLENHDVVLGTALLDMYAKCGALPEVQEVFDGLPVRDAVAWNALITGYAQQGLGKEALECYRQMRDEGFFPDAVTFVCILKACGSIGAIEKGEEIHSEVHRQGLLENKYIVLGNALVDMYAKCGMLAKAQEVFNGLLVRDVVSWTALIAGYAQHGHGKEAISCFEQMQDEGVSPNTVTFGSVLKACGSVGATEQGEKIHAQVRRLGLLKHHDTFLGTALVDMYAKCGALAKAQEVLDELPAGNAAAWTALITGYTRHGHGEEALKCFEQMRGEGFSPDAITYACILKACGSIGATEKGEEMHAEVRRQGLLGNNDTVLDTALVDMYAKCGTLAKAQEVFDELSIQNVASWNALIAGYARLGKTKEVFNLFSKMTGRRVEPDGVTFIALFTACSHAGLVEEGQTYFDIMSTVYHIIPTSVHQICMVDLFSRTGHFDKAINMIEKVPDCDLWLALLGACQKGGVVELGRWAFEHALQFGDKCSACK